MTAVEELCEEILVANIQLYNHTTEASKAVTLEYRGQYGIFVDDRRVATQAEMLETPAHEYGHCTLGATHKACSSLDRIEKHEYLANKFSVHKLLPFDDLMDALHRGYREVWELAEYFGLTEYFIILALNIYKREGFYQSIRRMRNDMSIFSEIMAVFQPQKESSDLNEDEKQSIKYYLDEAKNDICIIESTINIKEFFHHYSSILHNLEMLIPFQNRTSFIGNSPEVQLAELSAGREYYINEFIKRYFNVISRRIDLSDEFYEVYVLLQKAKPDFKEYMSELSETSILLLRSLFHEASSKAQRKYGKPSESPEAESKNTSEKPHTGEPTQQNSDTKEKTEEPHETFRCPGCGREVNRENFCPKCGTPLF